MTHKLTHNIIIQNAASKENTPSKELIAQWANAALANQDKMLELTIRIVSESEMTKLNKSFRNKPGSTNVLSFANEDRDHPEDENYLGDIAVCANIVNREADEQNKAFNSHWAHMIVHGIYHLLGYDHQNDHDAEIMETLEIKTLKTLGINNPYLIGDSSEYYE